MQPIVTQPRWLGRRIAESEYLWFNLNVKLNLPFECNLISWWNWISFINKWALGDIKSLNVGFHIPVQCLNLLICYCLFCKRSTVGGKIWIIGFQYWWHHNQRQIALLLYLSPTIYKPAAQYTTQHETVQITLCSFSSIIWENTYFVVSLTVRLISMYFTTRASWGGWKPTLEKPRFDFGHIVVHCTLDIYFDFDFVLRTVLRV